jgi:hypothetical protein
MRTSDLVDGMTKDGPVVQAHMPSSSIGSKTNEEIKAEANTARAVDDPLARTGIIQEENIPGFQPGIPMDAHGKRITKISTEADPIFAKSGLAIGDKIYHKGKKKEGVIKDMLASGGVIVKFEDGKKGTVDSKNLVKL